MIEWTRSNLDSALATLRQCPDAMPVDDRRNLAKAIEDAILCRSAEDEQVVLDLLDVLARDPDWSVRLEVARLLHLLDDDACSRLAAVFRQDPNSYVQSHAERGLARQRRTRHTVSRKRHDSRGYAERLDELARQYGRKVAAAVQTLADQRFAMLASGVTHNARSILTTLLPNVTALASEHGIERAVSILEDVKFLKRTIEAMEQFSKPLPDQRHPESLQEMIHQAVEKAKAGVIEQGYDLSAIAVDVGEVPTIHLRVARRLIVLALTNVIQNAIESFADRKHDVIRSGRIEVQVVVDGYETRICVRDNGPGMEPEVLKELNTFLPTGPNNSKRCSSGWGLSLVHKYITAHGGSVAIDSEMDKGTTVVLALPMRSTVGGDDE
ncbi:MAG TPA: sensor histidine kinase [Phycisphaerae bacterium]|nr:sensor histidine kinase [Phycisphaerae bacterium]HOQ88195.1 sensor histidine kinase [Phycisphaerae bacterium]HPP29251.1 sensor histidine kinase [Phycisphaerae bacterium]HPU31088.1 sensor histidine kinase [Phycisphaerae bacterium]